jgi:hypothetical protein
MFVNDLTKMLAVLRDGHLRGLRSAVEHSPDFVPGLAAWLEHAIDWEIDRRSGRPGYPLLGPRAAIGDTEIDRSLITLALLSTRLRENGQTDKTPVANFFEVSASVLRAEFERPGTLQ